MKQRLRKFLFVHANFFATALTAFFLSTVSLSAVAKVKTVDELELTQSAKHRKITHYVHGYIQRFHYKKVALDDTLSRQIFTRYLTSLDPNKSYFLQDDITVFNKYQDQFDDFIMSDEVTPAFSIFSVYRMRVNERVKRALQMLEAGFDFTRDEVYAFIRSEMDWPKNEKELDDVWRKRIKNDVLNLKLAGKEADEIEKTLTRRYQQLERRTSQFDADDVFQIFVNAYVNVVEPHTSYFAPQAADSFKISMSLSLEGIGAVLHAEDEYTVVRDVVPGGPADLQGALKSGDRIIGVGQGDKPKIEDVIGWRLDDVVDLIRGRKGTKVVLEVFHENAGAETMSDKIAITRDKINLEEQAAQKSVLEVDGPDGITKVGVITLPTFYIDFDGHSRGDTDYRSTTRDVRVLLEALAAENVEGIIVDLRGNGGGALSEAISLTGLFIKKGPVVQIKDAYGRIEQNNDPDPEIVYDGPLAVMVDRNSASASEIFSGAIQDYKRGLILGEPTFGKGTVQQLISLDNYATKDDERFGQLKVTTAQFFRVSGDSTQHRGVVPDIVFPTHTDNSNEGERALENALPWATINPARFVPFMQASQTDSFIKTRTQHNDRLNTRPEFEYLLEQIAIQTGLRERKELSLLESQRRIARDEQEKQRVELKAKLEAFTGKTKDENSGEDKKAVSDEDAKDDEPDILLQEAGRILADHISWSNPVLTVQTQVKATASAKIPTTGSTATQTTQ